MPVNNRYGGGGGHTAARRSECSARSTTGGFEFHPRTAAPVASPDMLRAAETELEAVARFGRDHGLAEVERSVPWRTVVLSGSCPALFRASAKRSRWTSVSTKRAGTYRGAPEQDRQSPHGLHIVHKPSAYALVLLIQ